MLQRLLLLVVLVLSACGTSKEVESAQLRIDEMQGRVDKLETDNRDLRKQVADLTAFNKDLSSEYIVYKNEAEAYKTKCQASQEEFHRLQSVLLEEEKNLEELERRLNLALTDFAERGVEVTLKDGLLYVTMEEELLYKSGSATLGKDGKAALGQLASVLNDYPKLKVIVLGNTDNVQFKKGSDNLSLSTERANGVVRILASDYKVDPVRLTSAGKGKFNPVADNSTAEGRAKNRRTDIIINPDLERLWANVKSGQ